MYCRQRGVVRVSRPEGCLLSCSHSTTPQFLQFAFQGHRFQFRVRPFSLSLSPRVVTRSVAAALSPLQSQFMKILPYLDNWLICAPSQSQVALDATLLSHVARLGHHHRCLPLGVGCCLAEPDSSGAVACSGPLNVLELRAVHRELPFFLPFLGGRHVLVRSYNVSTVSHINHQGGTRSARLLQAFRDLLLWAAPRLASLRAIICLGYRIRLQTYSLVPVFRRGRQYYIERQGAFYPRAVQEQVAAVFCMVFRQG